MATEQDKKRHQKALAYTVSICGFLLLMFIFISWQVLPTAPPLVPDELEINLGNNNEGFGEEQPLVKGELSPEEENTPTPPIPSPQAPEQVTEEDKVIPDENADENAAPVPVVTKKITPAKTITPKTIVKPVTTPIITASKVAPTPKPQTPKIVYNGPGKGGGNNDKEDNGYTMQGNNKNGKGDAGDPNGNKDSYGNTPGGKVGGPRVISGNRKVIGSYNFNSELGNATINAIVQINEAGKGTFIKIGQGSTNTSKDYANAITTYLRSMQFDKSNEESTVTVQFKFIVK